MCVRNRTNAKGHFMPTSAELRFQLLTLLGNGNAHMPFIDAVRDFPMDRINDHAPNVSYSPWHLLEHIRLVQRDILDYVQDDPYEEKIFPDDLWPKPNATADESTWNATIQSIRDDLKSLEKIVADESQDLESTVPTNERHTLLREIITVASHTHYHIGEFAILRQVMGTWGQDHNSA